MPRCGGCEGVCRCALSDSPTIDVTGSGTGVSPWQANLRRSAGIGNTVELRSDGLFVGEQSVSPSLVTDTATVDMAGDGSPAAPLRGDVKIASAFGSFGSGSNGLVITPSGLAAPPDHATRNQQATREHPANQGGLPGPGANPGTYNGLTTGVTISNPTRRLMRALIITQFSVEIVYNTPTSVIWRMVTELASGGQLSSVDHLWPVITGANLNIRDRKVGTRIDSDGVNAGQSATFQVTPSLLIFGAGFAGVEFVSATVFIRAIGFTE